MSISCCKSVVGPSFLIALALGSSSWPLRAAEDFRSALTFSVTDERPEFAVDLSRDLRLQVRRAVDAKGLHFGWDFMAIDRRLEDSPNFFYACLCGHGPSPHDLYAWHFAKQYYPAERILSIYGYPFEVRVRCVDCQAAGIGSDVRFTAGTVDVGWRRLATSNPRQLRISDLVRRKK
jgi:hypothetical protein